jgi:hypothetical protein
MGSRCKETAKLGGVRELLLGIHIYVDLDYQLVKVNEVQSLDRLATQGLVRSVNLPLVLWIEV